MPTPITATDLINQTRDILDEVNTINISDSDILQALNRGQDYATDLLSRHYPDPLLANATVSFVGGQQEYAMPEDIFEDKLQKVEVRENNIAWEVQRISYRNVSQFESTGSVSRPMYYYIMGKSIFIVPTPSGANSMRYWYLKEVETLVEPQGRITSIDVAAGTVVVNSLGSDLTTVDDELKNYINIVDAQTGKIKSSHQIQSLDTSTDTITIKSSGFRTSVWNRTIIGTLSSLIEVDDYVCLSRGNCIPYLKKPISNFIIQYAVVELKRKLGEPVEAEERAINKFEKQVKHQWAGREAHLRVSKRNHNWMRTFRRNFTSR